MSRQFDLYVSYSHLAVFQPGLDEPFNTWTDGQVEIGYSLRPGSVSFEHVVSESAQFVAYLGLAPGWRFMIGEGGYEDVWFDESLLVEDT
jgi:hypothetical protein